MRDADGGEGHGDEDRRIRRGVRVVLEGELDHRDADGRGERDGRIGPGVSQESSAHGEAHERREAGADDHGPRVVLGDPGEDDQGQQRVGQAVTPGRDDRGDPVRLEPRCAHGPHARGDRGNGSLHGQELPTECDAQKHDRQDGVGHRLGEERHRQGRHQGK